MPIKVPFFEYPKLWTDRKKDYISIKKDNVQNVVNLINKKLNR